MSWWDDAVGTQPTSIVWFTEPPVTRSFLASASRIRTSCSPDSGLIADVEAQDLGDRRRVPAACQRLAVPRDVGSDHCALGLRDGPQLLSTRFVSFEVVHRFY